jgi:hypothetical protein
VQHTTPIQDDKRAKETLINHNVVSWHSVCPSQLPRQSLAERTSHIIRCDISCITPKDVFSSEQGLLALQDQASEGCCPFPSRYAVLRFHQCDEGRPSCKRCLQRNEVCAGYRDATSLIFRDENEKAARPSEHRRPRTQDLSSSGTSSQVSSSSGTLSLDPDIYENSDASDLSAVMLLDSNLSSPYPWIKTTPTTAVPSVEDQAVSQFFEKFVMYPCNDCSSPGFLENLPALFHEAKMEGRLALRWAVRAAAYASLSNDQDSCILSRKALECYGLALSALGDALKDSTSKPDGYTLMTVVVLDLFEVS